MPGCGVGHQILIALMILQADRPAVTKLLVKRLPRYFGGVRLHVISRMEYEKGTIRNVLVLPTMGSVFVPAAKAFFDKHSLRTQISFTIIYSNIHRNRTGCRFFVL